MANGKGDKWRRGFDYGKYWENFDEIKKDETKKPKKVIHLKGGKTRYVF